MSLPDVPRVIYENNPLVDVVCKLRFPPVLRIDAEVPVAFQEAVRAEFPYYQVKGTTVKLPAALPAGLSQAIQRDFSLVGTKSYVFTSADRAWDLSLGRESLSLTCRRYRQWEAFWEKLRGPFDALLRLYRPSFFNHVCLRYKNVIRRPRMQPEKSPWADLLAPWIVGPVGAGAVSGDVESSQTRCVIKLPDEAGRVDATYGLAVEEPTKASVFLIDSHLYNDQQTGPSDVSQRLIALNRHARLFFRWCITDQLHRSLRPTEVPLVAVG